VAFAGVGVVATALQYGVLVMAVEWLDMNAVVGSSLGFSLSAVINYLLNYHFTFRSKNAHAVAASRFALIAAAGLALNAAVMALVIRSMHLPYIIAQLAATVVVLIWNFFGNALWSFAAQKHRLVHKPDGGQE
jgi:putative flippase GtrA